jgi:hypothetical protein
VVPKALVALVVEPKRFEDLFAVDPKPPAPPNKELEFEVMILSQSKGGH